MTYIKERNNLSPEEWSTKFTKNLRDKIKDACNSMIEEQNGSLMISKKVLNKVNAVNDCAVRLSRELYRKVTMEEVAASMGISVDIVKETIDFSSNNIEDIEL